MAILFQSNSNSSLMWRAEQKNQEPSKRVEFGGSNEEYLEMMSSNHRKIQISSNINAPLHLLSTICVNESTTIEFTA
ncbi:hypothetical protein B9Z55_026534 [Caenorhabditis nigoni]|uniref:Uncharacterized protein n=1 Tax=Caenorhabditis nigoni TaxID=1611254 RepID=A0A2G5T3R4_9PELO|nr:hypothetical protein B9Z55_026534 [Caenorhabditis nigoni]